MVWFGRKTNVVMDSIYQISSGSGVSPLKETLGAARARQKCSKENTTLFTRHSVPYTTDTSDTLYHINH